jgi:hypothetical protein
MTLQDMLHEVQGTGHNSEKGERERQSEGSEKRMKKDNKNFENLEWFQINEKERPACESGSIFSCMLFFFAIFFFLF